MMRRWTSVTAIAFVFAACSAGPSEAEIQERIDEAVAEALGTTTSSSTTTAVPTPTTTATDVRVDFEAALPHLLGDFEEALTTPTTATLVPEELCETASDLHDLLPDDEDATLLWVLSCFEITATGTPGQPSQMDVRSSDSLITPFEAQLTIPVALDLLAEEAEYRETLETLWRLHLGRTDGSWEFTRIETRIEPIQQLVGAAEEEIAQFDEGWHISRTTEEVLARLNPNAALPTTESSTSSRTSDQMEPQWDTAASAVCQDDRVLVSVTITNTGDVSVQLDQIGFGYESANNVLISLETPAGIPPIAPGDSFSADGSLTDAPMPTSDEEIFVYSDSIINGIAYEDEITIFCE